MTYAALSQAQTPLARIEQLESVTVSADPFGQSVEGMSAPAEVLAGDALIMRRQGTLGDTLNGLTGVHADTFGGGASRPVVRGQTSPRVLTLTDGSEVMDASAISPDHAVDVEPMLTQRLEVLRGPATLLYGGGAIGGVVNVIDDKIPTQVPEQGYQGSVDLRGTTGSNTREGAFALTAGEGNFAVHIEGLKRRSDDYRVPDWSTSRLAGSYEDTSRGSLGLSWVGSRGFLGVAYTQTDRKYGLPGHTHDYEGCHPHGSHLHCSGHDDHDHGHDDHDDHGGHDDHGHGHDHAHDEHGVPWVEARSKRVDIRGEYRQPVAGIERVRLRGGWTDYRHDEIEAGEVGTTFKNRGYDMRLEAEHERWGNWRGVAGLQVARSDLSAVGVEAFLPKTRTQSTGIFLLETYQLNEDWRFELGARHDWKSVNPENGQPKADFSAYSFSGAAIWNLTPAHSLSLSLSHSHRLPNAQELYANGVHLATNTYERGDPNLGKETSNNVDLTLRKHAGDLTFSVGVFHNRVKSYIYAQTVDQFEDFRLIDYRQHDAQFTGLEGQLDYAFNRNLTLGVFGDMVRGKLTGGEGNLPRIPAGRAGLRGKYTWQRWAADIELYRVFRQERIAAYEQETPGYNMMNLGVSYLGSLEGGTDYMVYLRATNLFDQRAMNHASFLATTAPLPGRRVTLGVRLDF
ncbi:TonB-dependent receptor [Pusillimonas sp. CC-YST705]|uniref:TonB-dependent receptor n=2 Tax=Mesopusillimonas faecipullorum TaxID=2755040 RepID=A0ABS8CDX4_9BURK|nr:TonB-dependent receptor [Mesopusillimonas faecipullorum]